MKDEVFSATDLSIACPHGVAQVLGVALKPVSIWHVWFLKSQESPFAEGGKVTESDIALGVLTCSRTREEIGALIADDDSFADAIQGLIEAWYGLTDDQLSEHVNAFDQYLTEGVTGPEFWEDPEVDTIKNRQRTPSEWVLVKMLLKEGICKTENEAWDYPYTRALCWAAVMAEENGSRNYIDPLDRIHIEQVNN